MVSQPENEDVEIVLTDGRLPEFWDRSTAFFANLLALFFGNEVETQRLADEVGEVDSYGGRLIPILDLIYGGSENVLILERPPDEELCNYFSHTLQLTLPRLETLSHEDYRAIGRRLSNGGIRGGSPLLMTMAGKGAEWVDGYVTDETLCGIAKHLGKQTVTSLEGSRRGNNKLLLFEHIRREGLPHAETEMAASVDDVPGRLEKLVKAGYQSAVLKAQIGASGIGILKLENIASGADLSTVEPHLFFEGPCMVQGWLEPGVLGVQSIRSPSVQMFLDEERVSLYDMTEQILSRHSVHEGNVSPPPYAGAEPEVRDELLRQAGIAGAWLHEQGYRGTASVDFLLVERSGQRAPEVHICEINARVTGATYPSILARHFTPRGAWMLRNLRLLEPMVGHKLLEMLDWPGHLYRRGDTFGVLPINFNFGTDGLVHKGQFLCLAETPYECESFLRAAESDLPVEWTFDRD